MDSTELLGRIGDSMHAGRSFGAPIEHDGCVVIPVAYVFGGGGGGGGTGGSAGDPSSPAKPWTRDAGGGGFGYVSWPVGAYIIRNGDVYWRPILDIGGITILVSATIRRIAASRRRRERRAAKLTR